MLTLAALQQHAPLGRLEWIGLRGERRSPPTVVSGGLLRVGNAVRLEELLEVMEEEE